MISQSICQRQEYDVIIAGAGTAGCVVATRLAETTDLNILLLEAGANHNEDIRTKIPAMYGQAISDPAIDWKYVTVPQPGPNGRDIALARGKGLGGSSLINLLGLVYPSKAGFDAWAEIGNDGWDWTSMVPYLKKFQTFHMPDEQTAKLCGLQNIDLKAQGTSGPIQASYPSHPHAIDNAWIETFKNMGYAMASDTMSGENIGGYQVASSIDPLKRERSHAGRAYLDRVRDKPNLEVVTNVLIDKVILSDATPPKASGIRFIREGQAQTVTTTKEIILCGGVFGSPAILERSGIGGGDLLRSLGIESLVENEHVGQNLHDHLMCSISFEVKEGIETLDYFRDTSYIEKAMISYQTDLSGPLATAPCSFAYMPLIDEHDPTGSTFRKLINQYLDPQSINDTMSAAQRTSLKFTRRVLEDNKEASANLCVNKMQMHCERTDPTEIFSFPEPENYTSILTALAHPLSRGSSHCVSANPETPPRIDPGYFSHPLDAELMSRQVQLIDKIVQTEPLKSVLKPGGRRIPKWTSFDSLKDTDRLMRESCFSNQHPCGTCAMLPRENGGVVDARLRVYGVEGLRVCDASIMPIITRGNLQSAVYAIGEKGADMIKQDLVQNSS